MSIEIKPTAASQVRVLHAKQANLTPHELHQLTGIPLKNVKAALNARDARDRVKSRLRPKR